MPYKHKSIHCEILNNKILFDFITKLFYLILQKLNSLKIPNIEKYFNVYLLDKKYSKQKVIQNNGLYCDGTNMCKALLKIKDYDKFYSYIKTNNINIMQITGIIYNFSSSEVIYRNTIRNDKSLSKEIISIYSDLFADKVTTFNEIEKIANKSEGDWFIPLILLYGKEKRTNIVNAGLNYDKIYVREALGYSRPIEKKDFNFYDVSKDKCLKDKFNSNKVVSGDSYFKIVENGIFENVMKKNKKEIISGYSGSCVMLYSFIFDVLKVLKKNDKNESLLLLMIILDFYPVHHSISEILVTYSREAKYLDKYYLNQDELEYLAKSVKYIV